MFVRKTAVKRGEKIYQYMQLVESERRESDGRSVHRVLLPLGKYDPVLFHNLNLAFKASREGIKIPVVIGEKKEILIPEPKANLRYLDIAVIDALWKEWGLDGILREVMPAGNRVVESWKVVEVLAAQRLVEPDSKLSAVRWFPRTALPEITGISPEQFNNTRVHRVLDELEGATPALMSRLAQRYQEREGRFITLFLDVTDTYFVGRGPDIAARGKTKEGLIQRKIGIVSLCNERGYPVRWEVIGGKRGESGAMMEMVKEISRLRWVGETPVVMDRGMGNSARIRELVSTDVRFLTALKRPEYSRYAPGLPWQVLRGVLLEGRDDEVVMREAAKRVMAAGMEKVDETMFVMDMGIQEIGVSQEEEEDLREKERDRNAWALRIAREVRQAVLEGRHNSYAAAGSELGVKSSVVKKYRRLLGLSEEIQEKVLSGEATGVPLAQLIKVAELEDKEAQHAEFEGLVARYGSRSRGHYVSGIDERENSGESSRFRVRVVVYFNPGQFVEQRKNSLAKVERIRLLVEELNRKLARPGRKSSINTVLSKLDRRLHKEDMVTLFHVRVVSKEVDGKQTEQVELTLNQEEWEKRTRYQGFSVLVGHERLSNAARELCMLYRSRDMVEKDFEIIKSVIELRPIRHRTELKVKAHVTLCMLALLIERTLREKLDGTCSPEMALETLESCHLNLYKIEDTPNIYSITQADPDQEHILKKLRLFHLVDDTTLSQKITPR